MDSEVEKIGKLLKRAKKKKKSNDYLSTGLTLVNLGISGNPNNGLRKGHLALFIGDSSAGKSWLLRQCMAELCNNPVFDNYRVIDDNPEKGTLMDLKKFFGQKYMDRVEPPSPNGCSKTLETFYDNVDDAQKDDRPFFYGLDSEDALPSEVELKKAQQDKKARRKKKGEREEGEDSEGEEKEEKIKGSYGTAKAKGNSQGLRQTFAGLDDSILVIIKQTRDNIGFDAIFNPKTRSGGRALTFYATLELWFSIKGTITKKIRGKERKIGSTLQIQIKKNRVAGRERAVFIDFYYDHGLDETGSNINFLVREKHWEVKRGKVIAPEFDFEGSKEKLVEHIESEGEEEKLKNLVVQVWDEIEEACTVTRKKRYD